MFHAQNQYMSDAMIYPTNGRELPQGEWSGEQMTTTDTHSMQGGPLRMKNLPSEVVEIPGTAEESYKGSLKSLLKKNVGNFIVATFLVGTQGTTMWEGVLFDVGNDYLTIYQEIRNRYIVGDIYSLKFIEFYDVERKRLPRTETPPGT